MSKDMPNLRNLPPEQRIKRYRAEIMRFQKRPGRTNEMMLKLYKGLLEAAEAELANQPLEPLREAKGS